MEWLRWYHGTTKDPKWRVIAKKSGAPISVVISIWAALLENASESEKRGTLSGWNPEDVAECFDVTLETVVTVCNAMQQKTLLHETVINFEKRNPKRERTDNSTDRVRKFRERKRHETPSNATKRLDKSIEENTNTVDLRSVLSAGFERLWDKYPSKDGRKQAEKHFTATVKTEKDLADCEKAFANYIEHLRVESWKKPKNGSTWFNNWRDWIDWKPQMGLGLNRPKGVVL